MRTLTFISVSVWCFCLFHGLQASTLDSIKKKGKIRCGVTTGVPGFSAPNSQGKWKGIDVDICRAIAAAIFNDPNKVQFVPLSSQQRITALQSREVDILSRNTTHTLTRDAEMGLNFGPTVFYDGQAFMVRKDLGVSSVKELNGASICTQQGTTTELNLADYFRANKMKFRPVVFDSYDEVRAAFRKGRCDAYTTDSSGLAAEKTKLKKPQDYIILPERISKEPLAPAVRHGDDQWFDIIKWTVYALIWAEENNISSKNLSIKSKAKSPAIQRFLGKSGSLGKALGLSQTWASQVIEKVGNYGEVFKRNIGEDGPLKLERGINALWTEGGLMYSPPFR